MAKPAALLHFAGALHLWLGFHVSSSGLSPCPAVLVALGQGNGFGTKRA